MTSQNSAHTCVFLVDHVCYVLFVWGLFPWLLQSAVAWQPGIKEIGRERNREEAREMRNRFRVSLVGQSFCVGVQHEGSCDFVSNMWKHTTWAGAQILLPL